MNNASTTFVGLFGGTRQAGSRGLLVNENEMYYEGDPALTRVKRQE
jgi:hypothetical protein